MSVIVSPEQADPAIYLPFMGGSYKVNPGLHSIGHDFGNKGVDSVFFQIDRDYYRYRAAKLVALQQSRVRDISCDYSKEVRNQVNRFIATMLCVEYPTFFSLTSKDSTFVLKCYLANESIVFDTDWNFIPGAYNSDLDALGMQIQEDFAVVCAEGSRNWISALSVCVPSYWRPEDKVGKSFNEIHEPVPGMELFKSKSLGLVELMIKEQKGLVRFVWSVTSDSELDHHPDRVLKSDRSTWYIRVERQVIYGFPEVSAALFLIRPYIYDAKVVCQDVRAKDALMSAIESMSDASLEYKGLKGNKDEVIRWIKDV